MPSEAHPHAPVHPRQIRIWNYIFLMRTLGAIYAFAALMTLFFSSEVVTAFNYLPRVLHVGEAMPLPSAHLWTTMAGSGLAGLSLLCFLASISPYQRGYAFVHLLVKAVSAVTLALYFVHDQPCLVYAIASALNATIFLSAGWGLLRLGRNLPIEPPPTEEPPPA